MVPIVYYINPNYDYENYDEENDEYGLGYNNLGWEKLTLVNMVWEGPEEGTKYYFLIDDTGEFYRANWEEFFDITTAWYTITPVELINPQIRTINRGVTTEEKLNFKFR